MCHSEKDKQQLLAIIHPPHKKNVFPPVAKPIEQGCKSEKTKKINLDIFSNKYKSIYSGVEGSITNMYSHKFHVFFINNQTENNSTKVYPELLGVDQKLEKEKVIPTSQ